MNPNGRGRKKEEAQEENHKEWGGACDLVEGGIGVESGKAIAGFGGGKETSLGPQTTRRPKQSETSARHQGNGERTK